MAYSVITCKVCKKPQRLPLGGQSLCKGGKHIPFPQRPVKK